MKTEDLNNLAHNLENYPLKEALDILAHSKIKLVVELSEDDFKSLVPEEHWNTKGLEINTKQGITFYPVITEGTP